MHIRKENKPLHIPAYKRWLSHFIELKLETLESAISCKLELTLDRGRLKLSSDDAIYSFEDRYTSFQAAFSEIKPVKFIFEKSLILGFGLGSIAVMLKHFNQSRVSIHGVELDPKIISLFHRLDSHFDIDTYKITEADAYHFVQHAEDEYDLICVDLFIGCSTPNFLFEDQFHLNLLRLLSPGGLIIFSTMLAANSLNKSVPDFETDILKPHYPNLAKLEFRGNVLYFSDKKYLK